MPGLLLFRIIFDIIIAIIVIGIIFFIINRKTNKNKVRYSQNYSDTTRKKINYNRQAEEQKNVNLLKMVIVL